ADATSCGLGSGGADSSTKASVLVPTAFDFTSRGAESGFFVGELEAAASGLSGAVAAVGLGPTVWVVELTGAGVLAEGAAIVGGVGARAGAGCPESCGALTVAGARVVLDLGNFP